MIFLPIQSVTALRITVTGTATNLFSLMDTAGSINTSQKYYSDLGANAIIITPEDGDIRWLVNGTPTTTIGTKISQGATLPFAGIDLSLLKLIAISGSVVCTIQLYKSEPAEGLSLGGGGGGVGGLAPSGGPAVGNPVLDGGVYNSVAPVLDSGDINALQIDQGANLMVTQATKIAGEDLTNDVMLVTTKPLAVSANAWSISYSASTGAGVLVKNAPGRVAGLLLTSTDTVTNFVVLSNTATAPGATPTAARSPIPVAAGGSVFISFFEIGDYFSTGISYGVYTTYNGGVFTGANKVFATVYFL